MRALPHELIERGMRRNGAFFLFWILFAAILASLFGVTKWYWSLRKEGVAVTLMSEALIGPRDVLTLHFSQPMQAASLQGKILIAPPMPVRFEWQSDRKTLTLIPEENWQLETIYQLRVESGKTLWFTASPRASFRFAGPAYPVATETNPKDGMKDVLVGIEDPLRVWFDRSVKDFYIDFRLDPAAEVLYQNNAEKTSFEILPKSALSAGTAHTLSIFAKWRGAPDTSYHALGTVRFVTKSALRTRAQQKDVGARVLSAKQMSTPRIATGKYIDINLRDQVMVLFENGAAVDAYPISSGKPGMDTPQGEFAIHNKAPRPWSKQYGLYMPYWQALTADGKYGIHELPEWPSGYKEGANHLGTPVSHGCVRLGVGAAERVFSWSDVGTPVVIY